MREISSRFVSASVVVLAAFAAVEVDAQSPGGYLPPNLPRPPVGAPPPAAYPNTSAPGSSAAASQIRLIEPDASPNVSQSGVPADGKGPEMNRDTNAFDSRIPSRSQPSPVGSDPTIPGPDIRNLIDNGNGPRNAPVGPPPLPEMRLRARIFARNKPPVAVIEVGGRPLSVRVGSEIQFSPNGGGVMQMKVVDITTSELQIEVVGRKGLITLN